MTQIFLRQLVRITNTMQLMISSFAIFNMLVKKRSTGINSSTIVAAVVVPIVIIIIVIVITIFLIRFYRHRRIVEFTVEMVAEAHLTGNPLYDKVADLRQPGPHEKEFSSDNITFVRELGEGAFGRVYQGIAGSIVPGEESTVVAVKQLKVTDASADDGAALVEFFKGQHTNLLIASYNLKELASYIVI